MTLLRIVQRTLQVKVKDMPTLEIQQRLATLNSVYHITEDRQTRQKMLLFIDELKLELQIRGINDKPI